MFRITEWFLEETTWRPGDFQGLVNVKEISGEVKDLPAGGFLGLESVTTMTLAIEVDGSVAP